MILLLNPNDVLLFRESKPFGIDYHLARTTLPLPQTIAGALRSAIYLKDNSKADKIGLGEEEPKFEIVGTFFYKRNGEIELLAECPKDVTSDFSLVKPHSLEKLGVEIFQGSDVHFRPLDAFIRMSSIARYLNGEVERDDFVERSEVFVKERRVGISLEEGKVARERHFYTAELLRIRDDCGLAVWVQDNLSELNSGEIIRLGGEGRFVRLDRISEPKFLSDLQSHWEEIRKRINKAGRLKLYLATPAIFENGAYTSKPDINGLVEKLGNVRIKNIYWLTGKPLVFSGWDYATKKPKATRYAIPAGSVYFVEFDGKLDIDKPYIKLGKLTRLGYGLCFVGVW